MSRLIFTQSAALGGFSCAVETFNFRRTSSIALPISVSAREGPGGAGPGAGVPLNRRPLIPLVSPAGAAWPALTLEPPLCERDGGFVDGGPPTGVAGGVMLLPFLAPACASASSSSRTRDWSCAFSDVFFSTSSCSSAMSDATSPPSSSSPPSASSSSSLFSCAPPCPISAACTGYCSISMSVDLVGMVSALGFALNDKSTTLQGSSVKTQRSNFSPSASCCTPSFFIMPSTTITSCVCVAPPGTSYSTFASPFQKESIPINFSPLGFASERRRNASLLLTTTQILPDALMDTVRVFAAHTPLKVQQFHSAIGPPIGTTSTSSVSQ
jgi:hypothetical protein